MLNRSSDSFLHTFRYRLKPYGGGMRTKVVKLEGWMQLMNDVHLIDSQFTMQVCDPDLLWLSNPYHIQRRECPITVLRMCPITFTPPLHHPPLH